MNNTAVTMTGKDYVPLLIGGKLPVTLVRRVGEDRIIVVEGAISLKNNKDWTVRRFKNLHVLQELYSS
jgi:hypothetical protein